MMANDLSTEVSLVLDWVGLSEEEIQWRRSIYKRRDSFVNTCRTLTYTPVMHTTGSRAEGVGMYILGSDTDIMFEATNHTFIFSLSEWEYRPDGRVVFVDTSDIHPGYCRLVRMYRDARMFVSGNDPRVKAMIRSSYREICFGDRVLIRSEYASQFEFSAHGPAHTLSRSGVCDMDVVTCFKIPWPPYADEWISRARPSHYPSAPFILQHRTAHVVPTGYKGSKYPNTEWRFSFSLVELELVHLWPLNISRCYVLMKLMKKIIASLVPHLSETLCSYHLKTTLFWLTEEMGMEFLNRCSLEECFVLSVERLLSSVERGDIPQYFIRTNKLFDLVAGTPRQADLVSILSTVMSEGLRFVLRDQLYQDWWLEMRQTLISGHGSRYRYLIYERALRHDDFANVVDYKCSLIIKQCCFGDFSTRIGEMVAAMGLMSLFSDERVDDISRPISYIIRALKSTCATQILSFLKKNAVTNRTSFLLSRISETMFDGTCDNEFSLLKQANFYYQLNKLKKAIRILEVVSDLASHRVHKSCHLDRGVILRHSAFENLGAPNSVFTNIDTSVIYTLPEVHAIPDALQFEVLKPDDTQPSTVDEDMMSRNSNVAFVDPDVVMYYLQYMCYAKIGKQVYAQVAFDNLCWTARQENVIQRPVALNILGHCYKERGQFRQAADCYVKSIRAQPKCNIALVHLAILLGKALVLDQNTRL